MRSVLFIEYTLCYVKRKSNPMLTKAHKMARLERARAFVTVVEMGVSDSSDEKEKLNPRRTGWDPALLVRPSSRRIGVSKHQAGGESLMVWGAFSVKGKSRLVILQDKQNSEAYLRTLQHHLLPLA
uniref:AlNc14C67G4734 protein n=1 Tax=Albugo laibachii Nc14 TaxID=890382 RepID=F0WDL4_9STRA|nr:AlNc14C67G4734 [Albugo laibachii Nc14]|eukprot:CCA19289.1 AlNc14C67G4734 [Albugo laibachii Nc14]